MNFAIFVQLLYKIQTLCHAQQVEEGIVYNPRHWAFAVPRSVGLHEAMRPPAVEFGLCHCMADYVERPGCLFFQDKAQVGQHIVEVVWLPLALLVSVAAVMYNGLVAYRNYGSLHSPNNVL